MLKFIRYGLATVCFAASIGCMALWAATALKRPPILGVSYRTPVNDFHLDCGRGLAVVTFRKHIGWARPLGWQVRTAITKETGAMFALAESREESRLFGLDNGWVLAGRAAYFPLWYPALIFALAGIGVIRLNRFTLRSAIIATTVVAGLLGMAVVR